VAKSLDIELDIVYLDRKNEADQGRLQDLNALKQVPIFVGSDGFVLTECIAILLYSASRTVRCPLAETPLTHMLVASQKPESALLGSTRKDYYSILKWLSLANSDLLPAIGGIILPLLGLPLAVRKNTQDCLRALHADLKLIETHLQNSKYLVGDQLTLADLFTAGTMVFGVMVFHTMLREKYPRALEWFTEIHGVPEFKDVVGELKFLSVPVPALEEDGETLEMLVDASPPQQTP
jgi:elongation factor 1-gamma